MQRKKIEALDPEKTKKRGHIATLQILDGVAIINFFKNKILESRYCIVLDTGEHGYWTLESGWKTGKLLGCLTGHKNYYYVNLEKATKDIKFDSETCQNSMEELFGQYSYRKDPWGGIESMEFNYDSDKRWETEKRRQDRLNELMKKIPNRPKEIDNWLIERAAGEDYMFWHKEQSTYGCTNCGAETKETDLSRTDGNKKIRHNDQVICPKCKKEVTVKKRNHGIAKRENFYLIQQAGENASVIRFYDAEIDWTYGSRKVYMGEGIRIIAYKHGTSRKKYGYDIYYSQSWPSSYNGSGFDKGNSVNKRAKEGYLYPGPMKETLNQTIYESAGRVLEQLAEDGERLDYNALLIGANKFEGYAQTIEYLRKGKFRRLMKETIDNTDWWGGGQYYGSLHLNGATAEEVFGICDRQKINRIRDMDGGKDALQWMRWSEEEEKKIPQDTLLWLIESKIKPKAIQRAGERMNPQQIKNYIEKQKALQYPTFSNSAILEQFEDYLQMCEACGKNLDDEMVYRPRELKKRHDEVVQDINQIQILRRMEDNPEAKEAYAKEMREKYPSAEANMRSVKEKYEYENEIYAIIMPTELLEIVKEGQALHHCCGSSERYFDRIEDKETYTCFLRRQSAPGIPYYTIEIEPSGTIRQHRSYLDEEPGVDEIRGFLKEWQQVIKKRLTAEDRKLAKISEVKRIKSIEELKRKNNTRVLQALEEDFLENVIEETA